MNSKIELRNEMKKRLKEMNHDEYFRYSNLIKEKLISSKEWTEAKTIGITISTGREVNTKSIIETGWDHNKTIVVPKCFPKEKQLRFYKITSFNEVEESFYSLKEPIVEITSEIHKDKIDLLIVPGLIFDSEGYRIGFGGGYYDRYLSNYEGETLSLAFQFQIIDHLPIEKHDIPIEKIISHT